MMDAERIMLLRKIEDLQKQLEEEKTKHQHTYECAVKIKKAWAKVKLERDVLMNDMKAIARETITACLACKHSPGEGRNCPRCGDSLDCFVWRGLCVENGGAENEA